MHNYIEVFFWICIFIVFYTYIGYGILLFFVVKVKQFFQERRTFESNIFPKVTFLIVAYNEEDWIAEKIINSLNLEYSQDKVQFLVVTDGSDDNTPKIVSEYSNIQLLHKPERKGKIKAIERAMPEVTGDIVVFSDANTMVNKEALLHLVKHFRDEKVGVVAGEKRIISKASEEAAGAGESIYWKYESKLKKWDDELYSVMGAAGELYAIRKELYDKIPGNTIIEDFYLSMRTIQKGYKISYEPEAYAIEQPSASIKEEFKRKTRIAAGGIQAIVRLKELMNPFKYGVVVFQFISHRVLRWTLAPLLLPVLFVANLLLLQESWIYVVLCYCQILLYTTALLGYLFEKRSIRLKPFFVPFYFFMMNIAVYVGFFKYLTGSQSVVWEKSARRGS